MSNTKRFLKELEKMERSPPEGCVAKPLNDDDMSVWKAEMKGPAGTVYAAGKFIIDITLPKEYPFKPPVLSFRTKIYHPNVSNDERGTICLGILKAGEWKPANFITDVLKLVRAVLAEPQADDPVEPSIAKQYMNDRAGFDKTALEWTAKFAKP